MKNTLLTLTTFTIIAFSTTCTNSESVKVEYAGALNDMMQQGDVSAKANLKDFQNKEHLYALGALEQLKGEILILDGMTSISSVQNQELAIDNSFNYNASLLVYATVAEWKSFEVGDNIESYEDLETYVEYLAKENGINTEEPFPFLLNGVVRAVDWHVVNWINGDMEHSHEKHIASGLQGTIIDQEVEILGFYSNKHHTIFTHHTTNMHLHVKTKDHQIAGHLDGLTLGNRFTLKLPATQ